MLRVVTYSCKRERESSWGYILLHEAVLRVVNIVTSVSLLFLLTVA